MKVLVCKVSERSYAGFDIKGIVGVGRFDVHEIPQKTDNLLGAIAFEGKIYSVVVLNELLGGKKIKAFVILRNGFAVGVYDIDGIYRVDNFMEVEGMLKENFERAFVLNGDVVYLLEEKFFSNLPKVPQDIEIELSGRAEIKEKKEEMAENLSRAFLVEVDSEKFVVPRRMVKEVQSAKSAGKFRYGNIYGFTYYEGDPVPIIWKKPIRDVKWIVVLEGGAIPCIRVQAEEVKFEKSDEGIFACIDGVRYRVYDEKGMEELLRWI